MRRRTLGLLLPAIVSAPLLGLSACQGNVFGGTEAPPPPVAAVPPPEAQSASTRVAALLPLSGPEAPLGASMLQAIRLALGGDAASLDVLDTGGTGAGAARAASDALAKHDGLILGPLTSAETREAARVASPAGVPILAYTSDPAVARPGVWPLGLTPLQQVARLVDAARADGRSKFAAFLPRNALGDAMAESYAAQAPGADIRHHDQSFASINDGLKALADYDSRAGDRDRQIKADKASSDPAVRAQADVLAAEPTPPPPFDTLLLADTGTQLQEIIDLLGPYAIPPANVRIMGPALWGKFARKLGPIAGAWYAAPDPAARTGFAQAYQARYHVAPNGLDDIAYDSAALAGALLRGGAFSSDQLTRADGFAGTDGVFVLDADGHVRRGLAVFQVDQGGGAHIVSPAPSRLPANGV